MKNYTFVIVVVIILAACLLLGASLLGINNDNLSVGGNTATAVDLIGTRVGTSTTGVAFTSTSTVTSYRKFIGGSVDEAVLNIIPTAASNATVYISVLASNDSQCDVSTTTSSGVNAQDINWYDALYTLKGLAGSTTFTAATSTITWSPTLAKAGKQIVLTNLNTNCLRFDIAATSTTLYAQLKTKQNQ